MAKQETPPAPGQVWKKDLNDYIYIKSLKSYEDGCFEIEFWRFGVDGLYQFNQEQWAEWSATATLVDGGDTDV